MAEDLSDWKTNARSNAILDLVEDIGNEARELARRQFYWHWNDPENPGKTPSTHVDELAGFSPDLASAVVVSYVNYLRDGRGTPKRKLFLRAHREGVKIAAVALYEYRTRKEVSHV